MAVIIVTDSAIDARIGILPYSFRRDTLALVPGITDAVAIKELQLACVEFYTKSQSFQHTVEQWDLSAGRNQYRLLSTHVYVNVVAVLGVALNGQWLPSTAVRPRPPSPDHDDTAEAPTSWFIEQAPELVGLYPDPTVADVDALSFRVALAPKEAAVALPVLTYSKHYDAILDGYLARVLAHQKKPYSAPAEAAKRLRRFHAAIAEARAESKQGYTPHQHWRFPGGWR